MARFYFYKVDFFARNQNGDLVFDGGWSEAWPVEDDSKTVAMIFDEIGEKCQAERERIVRAIADERRMEPDYNLSSFIIQEFHRVD
ncbi:MAG TPA: hypothetical protein VGI93_02035 [Steroidobacteraceae bacterium]